MDAKMVAGLWPTREVYENKEEALRVVAGQGRKLLYVSLELRGDRDVVLAAVKQDGWALKHASEELRADRDVVLEAVRENEVSLRFAGEPCQADRELVLEAVKKGGLALEFASKALQADREVVSEALKQDAEALQHASESIRADRELVLDAIKRNGAMLKWAGESLRADPEVVMEAVRRNGRMLEYASETLRGDRDIVVLAVQKCKGALADASDNLQEDKDVLLLAARFETLAYIVEDGIRKAGIDEDRFWETVDCSSIAVAGESRAPIVAVALSLETNDGPPQGDDDDNDFGKTDSGQYFRCEVSLLSGANFTLRIDDCKCRDLFGNDWPTPVLEILASKILEGLPPQMEKCERIFINFELGPDHETLLATPWDWDRPLKDFLRLS